MYVPVRSIIVGAHARDDSRFISISMLVMFAGLSELNVLLGSDTRRAVDAGVDPQVHGPGAGAGAGGAGAGAGRSGARRG